ncbi:hypothetical protein EV363DRAFT_1174006, partial [Boletus edulis]
VILITVVVYDFFLTLSREIDYVWLRPWNWISTMFLLIRYFGLSLAILTGLLGSTFLSGNVTVGTVTSVVVYWQLPIFIAAADLVMIAWVYVMWNRSKRILGVLLSVYVPQVILSFVVAGVYSYPHDSLPGRVNQVPGFSTCDHLLASSSPVLYFNLLGLRAAISIMLLVLVAIQSLKQSVWMYKATKQWQPNQYMQLLIRDEILYFAVYATLSPHLFSSPSH